MAFVPTSNVLKIEVRGAYHGAQIETLQYHQHTGAIDGTAVAAIFDFYEDFWLPEMLATQSSDLAITELYGTDLTSSVAPTYSRVFSPELVGEVVTAGLPSNVAGCISFRTAGRGRSARGRNYVPGLGESQVTGDDISLTVLNDLVAAYELMLGGGDYPASWVWGVVSLFLNNAPRIAGYFQEITDVLSTSTSVESQRGRLE